MGNVVHTKNTKSNMLIYNIRKSPNQNENYVVYNLYDENNKVLSRGATKSELITKAFLDRHTYFFKVSIKGTKLLLDEMENFQMFKKLTDGKVDYFEFMKRLKKSLKKVSHCELTLESGVILYFATNFTRSIEYCMRKAEEEFVKPVILSESFSIKFHKSLFDSFNNHFGAFNDYFQCFTNDADYYKVCFTKLKFKRFVQNIEDLGCEK